MMKREDIANELLALAEDIAERRHNEGVMIESLSDKFIPDIANEGIKAVVQDAVESWAYTWLDVIRGGIKESEADRGDAFYKLIGVPLEKHITTL